MLAYFVLAHSMKEPFETLRSVDLVWQLIIPSAFLVCTVWLATEVFRLCFQSKKVIGLCVTPFLLFCFIVFLEAVYGYMWDVRVHMS